MRSRAVQTFGFILCGLLLTANGASLSSAQSPVAASLVALAPGGNLPILESDVLLVVPENAYGVIIGANILETKATVERVMRKLGIPFDRENDYAEFTKFLEGLRGWNAKASHALAFLPGENGSADEFVVLVPVTNYKEFAASMGAENEGTAPTRFKVENGPEGYIAEKAGFAVLGDESDLELVTRVVASKKGVTDIGSPMRAWIGKQQAVGLLLPAGLKKMMDEVIDGLEKARGDVPADAPEAAVMAGVFDVYADLLESARDEVTLLAMGVRLDDTTGLDVAMLASFKPDGKLAAAAKDIAPLPAKALAGLPEGEFFVAGAGVVPKGWTKGLMDFSLGLISKLPKDQGGVQLDPKDLKELLEAAAESAEGIKHVSMSMGLSGKTFFDRAYGVIEVENSSKFIEKYETSIRKQAAIVKKAGAGAGVGEQTVERKKIDGRDVLVVTTDMAAVFKQAEAGPGGAGVKTMLQTMFGGAKLSAYVTAIDADTVLMTYGEEALKVLADDVKQGKAGLADDANIRATAAMLPAEAHWVGYMNVGGYVELAKKIMAVVMAQNGGIGFMPPIPPFPDAPPVGFSTRISSTSLEGHFVVPMELAESVRDYVMQMQGVFGGGLR